MAEEPNPELDAVDRGILHQLQLDARRHTNAEIAERLGVSPSTVSKRLAALEERGVLEGYRPKIDYEAVHHRVHVLLVCTAPIPDRTDLVRAATELDGVVNVLELMTGDRNVHVQAVGRTMEEITEVANRIDAIGLTVNDEHLVRTETAVPYGGFAVGGDGSAGSRGSGSRGPEGSPRD